VAYYLLGDWTKELNLVSWNERDPKYDIRDVDLSRRRKAASWKVRCEAWSPDHEKMGKGVTLSAEEAAALRDLLADSLEEEE
jgi:hypothetical protein